MMMSRGHVLYFILLPLVAQAAAEDTDEQMMSEPHSKPSFTSLPDSLLLPPPALLFHLLQSSQRAGAAPSAASVVPGASSSVDSASAGSESMEGDDDNGEVSKRVFCNGFTGCGGRHRDRSRRQGFYGKRLIPLLVKRPFCNSFGCYNGKRSLPQTPTLEPMAEEEEFRARFLARLLAASQAFRHHHKQQREEEVGAETSVGKRLFCNGYGGCRGFKRSLFSPWMSKMNGVVENRR